MITLPLEKCMSAIIDYRGKTPRKTSFGVPLITAKVVKGGRIETPDEFIDPNEYEEWMRRGLPQVGDVVITTEAPLGEVAQLSDSRIALAQRLILLRGEAGLLDNTYLKYLLMSDEMQAQLASRATGTTVVGIKQSELRKLTLSLPEIGEQEAIAAVLGALDDKIEQNRRTARALESLMRSTFKAWFVDFEPIKAKSAGQTSFPGVSPFAFAALPDRLTDSALGSIPQGWAVQPLSTVCRIVSGGTPKRSEGDYWNGNIPWYSVKDAPSDGMPWIYFTDEQITPAGLNSSAATLVPVGCTIISARGTVGRLALAARPMTFNQSCYGLLPVDGASYRHLYLLVRQVVGELQQRTHGSVFDTITRQTFDGVSVVCPPSVLIGQFDHVVAPLFDLLLAALRESHKLTELRDYLLPRLLSGSLRVEASHG